MLAAKGINGLSVNVHPDLNRIDMIEVLKWVHGSLSTPAKGFDRLWLIW